MTRPLLRRALSSAGLAALSALALTACLAAPAISASAASVPAQGVAPAAQAYGTTSWWARTHPELLLRGADGTVIIDEDWNEALFDVRTDAKRTALAAVQKPWIQKCKSDGFDAVEPDNLDSETRSVDPGTKKTLMTHAQVRAYLATIVPYTHSVGLAIAQKNTLGSDTSDEWRTDGARFGFDFGVSEECQPNGECGAMTKMYPGRVFEIEYRKAQYTAACSARGATISVIYRDRDVVTPGKAAYRYEEC